MSYAANGNNIIMNPADAATKSEAQLKCTLPQGTVDELGKYLLRVTREGHGYADAMLTYAA